MATHDYIIDNQSFPSFRSDLNNVLSAIVSNNSNGSSPSTTYAFQMWYDTSNNFWYMRNAANSGWIQLATFNQGNNTVMTLANGSVAIAPAGHVSVGGGSTQSGEIRFLEDTDSGSNYVALKSATTLGANTTFVLPTADGSANQVIKTDGSGNLGFVSTSAGVTAGFAIAMSIAL